MIQIKQIIPPDTIGNTAASLYEAETLQTIIDKFTATNVGASPVLLDIYIVPSGETQESDERQIIKNEMIIPDETYVCDKIIGHYMERGDELWCNCDVADHLVIAASGREIS